MHNKSWIADNRIAIVGGRNLGDEYFGASDEVNFVDLDFAHGRPGGARRVGVVRPLLELAVRLSDWSCSTPMRVDAEALEKLRALPGRRVRAKPTDSRYAHALRDDDRDCSASIAGDWPHGVVGATTGSSPTIRSRSRWKKRDAQRAAVSAVLLPAMRDAHSSARRHLAVFRAGRQRQRRARGRRTRRQARCAILTNSLAANDVAAVHGGYSRYRKTLLEGGVQLWELKPLAGGATRQEPVRLVRRQPAHQGAVDRQKTLFVGSYNLDPRSTWLNCEQGVLVESPVLAAQFRAIFESQTAGSHAWRVSRRRGELRWADDQGVTSKEPRNDICAAHAGLVRARSAHRRAALSGGGGRGARGTKVSFFRGPRRHSELGVYAQNSREPRLRALRGDPCRSSRRAAVRRRPSSASRVTRQALRLPAVCASKISRNCATSAGLSVHQHALFRN